MFYNFFRLFFLIGLRAYFKKIKVEGAENIPANTPVILLCNHQSAIMDALLTGSCFKQKIYFMARGETFSTKFKNWFMMQVNAIPIYRPDMSPGMEWKNKATMNECYKLFDKNKIIITFPEGLSFTEPRIRPLKNGMVRIALGYGDYHAFAKELVIVPMGINYEDSHKFRTQVLVKVGQPIKITDYEKLYKEKKPEAIKQMINEVKEQLEVLTLIIDKPENEIAIETAASMKGVYKESIIKDFNGLKETYSNLNVSMTDGQKSALENIAQKAKKLGTDIRTINQLQSETGWDKIKNVLVLILVFPIFLSGLVNSAIRKYRYHLRYLCFLCLLCNL
ncbi:MAG: lysophospholipid acyltransferase family protein [Bacteroidetes bacterium]|nr:lysophospholipid acyltransferase family protein [Bacteroidota bacterium]